MIHPSVAVIIQCLFLLFSDCSCKYCSTNHRLRLCGLWQPGGCFKGCTCSENQRHTGPDGQGEFGTGMCVSVSVRVCECAYLSCLWASLWGCTSLMCACVRCVLENGIRLVTWPRLTSCSSRDPIYFHCRNQMSRLSLPNNLSVSVWHVTHRTTSSHTHTPSWLGWTV